MASWEQAKAFIKGTRPRPPPGPRSPRTTALLVVAALCHLPLVYLLVGDGTLWPLVTIAIGLVSMGLAWSGGVALEGRRPRTTRAMAALGVAEGALAFVPPVADAVEGARWLFVAIAALCAGALAVLQRPTPKGTR